MNAVVPAGILDVGIHEGVSHGRYHEDPCPEPSLSSSVAHLLVHRSPLHAWAAHPRLNTMREDDDDASVCCEEGTLLHALLLRQPFDVEEVEANDWRTKAAQERRRDARDRGAIPVLSWRMAQLERCARAFHLQLALHEECAGALDGGTAETTLIWREGTTWCRARPDYRHADPRAPFYDLKTTAGSADPETWEPNLRKRYALQAAWYLRGARALGLRPNGMVFLVLETKPPHGLMAFAPEPDLIDIADRQISDVFELWEASMKAGVWPGYPRRIHRVDAKPWELANAEIRDVMRPARLGATKPTRQAIEIWNKHLLDMGASA